MGQTILRTLRDTWEGYAAALSVAIPRLLVMAVILAVGWLVAWVAQRVTLRLLRLLRFEAFSERTGAAELLRKAELPPAARVVGSLVFWLLVAIFLFAALDALGLEAISTLRDELLLLLPRLITSLAVLVVGVVLANLAWRVALLAAVNAGWRQARLASGLVYALVVALAAAMALDTLQVGRSIVLAAFIMGFGAIVLALAIAVGIGAAPLVRRALEERLTGRSRPDTDGSSHL